MNTQTEQEHILCCRPLEASLAHNSHTYVPRYLCVLQYRRVQTLALQNAGAILRIGKHLAKKNSLLVCLSLAHLKPLFLPEYWK